MRVGEAVQPVINLLRDHLLGAHLVLGNERSSKCSRNRGEPPKAKATYGRR
ncbi:protein of unknown function [Methylocaldum szegediense]|uniref:Uncharacterized protein n=2 Tax=Methylocaldum szegediense TaxID=73780 RepID=A0ABM9I6L8_9GAMM|nr:protein of unknown function [Methylocaldum szegediense]